MKYLDLLTNKKDRQKGAALMVSIVFFLFLSLAITAGLVAPSVREFRNANTYLNSRQAYFLAESGVEDVAYRTINGIIVSATEVLSLEGHTTTTTSSTLVGNLRQIISLGDVNNFQRQIDLVLRTGEGVVFKYGTQAGQGGFFFGNNAFINGNIYSNGNIVGSNGAYITGSAFVAGDTGSISNMRVGYGGTGDAHANSVTGSTVTGNLYCKVGSSNNKACDTSQPNPTPQDLPISDENIAAWKADAENGGVINGSVTISTPTTMGAKKIIGNLTIDSTLTIADTIYVTGNLIININKTLALDSSYGATSGIIIADGYIVINNGVTFEDSGTDGSYILLLSESTCDDSVTTAPCNGNNAIRVSNNSDISIVNAQKGTIYFSNNAQVKEAVGNKIELSNNVGISYGSGLINVNFTSGPSGAWVIDSWGEGQ